LGDYDAIENYFSQTSCDSFSPELQKSSILQINKPMHIRQSSSAMSTIRFRKHVSIPGLLSTIRTTFTDIPDPVRHRGHHR